MIIPLQNIYSNLYQHSSKLTELDANFVYDWLRMHIGSSKEYSAPYQELLEQAQELHQTLIPVSFFEKFCLSKLSGLILSQYPVNIAEAYTLAFIILNDEVSLTDLYFKLGTSGLLSPTLIKGEVIQDIEAVAKFALQSLQDAKLIAIIGHWAHLGKNFELNNVG